MVEEPVAYSSGHIKNALPLGLDDVISISENGANLAIEGEAAENLFGKLGIDESKKVVVYGEHFDPSGSTNSMDITLQWSQQH